MCGISISLRSKVLKKHNMKILCYFCYIYEQKKRVIFIHFVFSNFWPQTVWYIPKSYLLILDKILVKSLRSLLTIGLFITARSVVSKLTVHYLAQLDSGMLCLHNIFLWTQFWKERKEATVTIKAGTLQKLFCYACVRMC